MNIGLLSGSNVEVLINCVLALIMFALGLSLTISHFSILFRSPAAIIIGLTAQMVILPLVAFFIAIQSHLSPELRVGLMILAICPGGSTSGIITYFFKGDVALSIVLTAVNSLLSLITIPLLTNLALQYFMQENTIIQLPIAKTAGQIFSITIVPALAGVFMRHKLPVFATKIQVYLKYVMTIMLAIVFMIKFFADKNAGGTGITMQEALDLLPVTLIINIVGFVIGYLSGIIPNLGHNRAFTIGIEVAMHNTTLAFVVAGSLLHNQTMVNPSLVYSMFSFWTALLFGFAVKWLHNLKFSAISKQN